HSTEPTLFPYTTLFRSIFVRAVFASLRRRARSHWGIARSQGGAVTFVQRFGDALNLNVHFHSLVLDGVYARTPEGRLRFYVLPRSEEHTSELQSRENLV